MFEVTRSTLQPEDAVVGVERELGGGDVVAAHRVGEEALAALGGPLHRPAQRPGGVGRHRVLGIEERLHPEAAADVGRDHPHLLRRPGRDWRPGCREGPSRPGCRSGG